MATTTAMIMISTLSTRPTAVSMESNENTHINQNDLDNNFDQHIGAGSYSLHFMALLQLHFGMYHHRDFYDQQKPALLFVGCNSGIYGRDLKL